MILKNKINNNLSKICNFYLKKRFCLNNSILSEKIFTPINDFDPSPEIVKNYKKYIQLNIEKVKLKKIYDDKIILLQEKSGNINPDSLSLSDSYNFISNLTDFNRELKDIRKIILTKIAQSDDNTLKELSEYNFLFMGKMIRPVLIILVSKYIHECITHMNSTGKKNPNIHNCSIENVDFFKSNRFNDIVKPFAASIEAVHNASLLHDDIIDNSNERRNRKTAHNIYGIRETVFSANYIISKSVNLITDLGIPHLNQIYSGIVLKLTEGECQQSLRLGNLNNLDESFYVYMHKTYYKTASLLALSLRGVGIIYDLNLDYQRKLFDLGLHIGIVFQLVDDVLDVLYDSIKIKKPALKDLTEGVINSHILYECIFDPDMLELASRKFKGEKDIDKAVEILRNGLGILKTQNLAIDHLLDSIDIISSDFFIENNTRKDLLKCFLYIVNRCY